MLRMTALVFFLCFSQPAGIAVAQDPRLSARLDSVTRVQVESVLTRAHDDGLPIEPLVQKALEGSSKGAPGPRIVAAVEAMRGDLRRSRQSLGRAASADELVAGAAALRAGATPAMVEEIQRTEPEGGLAVPLAVFADLVGGGMTVQAAWRSVSELAREGGNEEEFLELRERILPARESP